MMGKAVAMNAYRNGSLESLILVGWFNNAVKLNTFIKNLSICNKDHELMYGDKKLAAEMEKLDLEKNFNFKLKFLNIR